MYRNVYIFGTYEWQYMGSSAGTLHQL